MFLKGEIHSSIGLDIGKSSVKMLQFRRNREKSKPAGFVYNSVNIIDYGEKEEAGKELIVKAVKETYRKNLFKGKKVITSFPAQDVDFRQINVPDGNHEEIIKAIGFEADSY